MPGGAECHVWYFPLTLVASEREELWQSLTPDERERANRYKVARPREQFVTARGRLRQILAAYLGVSPAAVELVSEPDGKPILRGVNLPFNVSHSGDLGLIAVADRRVGVDVEQLRDVPNAAGLVERFFGPEEREQFARLPAELQLPGFLRGWTCKEALLKAVGTGIQNVNKCVVDLDPRRAPAVIRFDHAAEIGRWQLGTWSPVVGYVAAVALECDDELRLDSSRETTSPAGSRRAT
ncbi:4'-phosphopantetheinyl transferase [Limnoglobus roseus]|uniref:4'-phosphopantetheinyl transferase n=2 Tax=Limnoglobus roseus TaxID=2598579 RepID=A0A5C1AU65_9BACT|nr:4'-phosphopantetheinyl transferase [Limnoglobus roseus]